jgi:hypothetical protein
MKTKTTTLAAILATSVASFAGTTVKTASVEKTEPSYSGFYGINALSSHINKGTEIDNNPIFQPFAGITVPTKLELAGVKTSVVLETRQNLHTDKNLSVWARSEVNAGILLSKNRISLLTTYELVTSPNKSFDHSEGLNFTLSFDDSGLAPISLNPRVKAYVGINSGFESLGNYYEVGVAPSFVTGKTTVSFPVNLGVGSKNFYKDNERYGYSSVGLSTVTPVFKNTALVAGVNYLNTNDKINSGKKDFWLTSAGLVVSF